MKQAQSKRIPIIFDPVGAGATPYRTETARKLIRAISPAIIRGNASEIMAVAADGAQTKGVDSLHTTDAAFEAAQHLAKQYGSVVCISGAEDIIVDNNHFVRVKNGHPLMGRVTGMGCTATAICGAFAAVNADPFQAATHAMITMGIAGEIAAEIAHGPGTMQLYFLDALHQVNQSDIEKRIKIEG